MDTGRVDRLVDDLTSAFEAALGFYSEWKQKQERNNHYYRKAATTSAKESKCTLSTSLDISSHRIKATYQVGFALIGPEFARGDCKSSRRLARASLTSAQPPAVSVCPCVSYSLRMKWPSFARGSPPNSQAL
jgi:hypothetical protein